MILQNRWTNWYLLQFPKPTGSSNQFTWTFAVRNRLNLRMNDFIFGLYLARKTTWEITVVALRRRWRAAKKEHWLARLMTVHWSYIRELIGILSVALIWYVMMTGATALTARTITLLKRYIDRVAAVTATRCIIGSTSIFSGARRGFVNDHRSGKRRHCRHLAEWRRGATIVDWEPVTCDTSCQARYNHNQRRWIQIERESLGRKDGSRRGYDVLIVWLTCQSHACHTILTSVGERKAAKRQTNELFAMFASHARWTPLLKHSVITCSHKGRPHDEILPYCRRRLSPLYHSRWGETKN